MIFTFQSLRLDYMKAFVTVEFILNIVTTIYQCLADFHCQNNCLSADNFSVIFMLSHLELTETPISTHYFSS